MNERYKSFPPGLGHIKVPLSSRQGALAALAMYTACKPSTLRLQKIAWTCTKWFGPWILPGSTPQWIPPMSRDAWEEILQRWRSEFGPFDSLAICGRLQSARSGLMFLLLRQGTPIVFVKLRRGDDVALSHELRVLKAIFKFTPTSFFVPEPYALGAVDEWTYLGTAVFPPELHRVPENPPLDAMLSEIDHALAEIPRPTTTPSHWRPMHGDFTPWNLRQFDRHGLVLYDWEDASWGPPGADDVLYRATAAALRGDTAQPHEAREAVHFWQDRLHKRSTIHKRDDRLAKSLRNSLMQMAAQPYAAHP